jgi:hypothetical protein
VLRALQDWRRCREAACVHVRRRQQRSARGGRRPSRARTSAREERGRPGGPTEGHWAGWLVGQRGGEGRWAAAGSKTRNGPKFQKEILFEFQLILEIWQKFGKLHKEI